MSVRVQSKDFDLSTEVAILTAQDPSIGAVVTFSGIVRDKGNLGLTAMELEHYPAMTEAALADIEEEAHKRFSLQASLIIHRVGKIPLGGQIMMVATASIHRHEAFAAAEFLMDYLKTDAPFWKKEHLPTGAQWVDARVEDDAAKARWTPSKG